MQVAINGAVVGNRVDNDVVSTKRTPSALLGRVENDGRMRSYFCSGVIFMAILTLFVFFFFRKIPISLTRILTLFSFSFLQKDFDTLWRAFF